MPTKTKDEVVESRSPAEFFAENQNIAGFDNPGKSLYTTIRELVENSLDAAESIGRLPSISLTIVELTAAELDALRAGSRVTDPTGGDEGAEGDQESVRSGRQTGSGKKKKGTKRGRAAISSPKKKLYYRITCRDNGCGMPHEAIPNMLGRVLSGSKYGVRQTRGKFGLGAKMALIWAKKSTGMPIEVRSSHTTQHMARREQRTGAATAPKQLTECVLDIDILRNQPKIIMHRQVRNEQKWTGSELTVTIGGAWTAYRSRVMQYLQQLAVITPYAEFQIQFVVGLDAVPRDLSGKAAEVAALRQRKASKKAAKGGQPAVGALQVNVAAAAAAAAGGGGSREFLYQWRRRSTQLPPPSVEVKHHPASVNNLLVQRLVDRCLRRLRRAAAAAEEDDEEDDEEAEEEWGSDDDGNGPTGIDAPTVWQFLQQEFSCVSANAAEAMIHQAAQKAKGLNEEMPIDQLTDKHIHALTKALQTHPLPQVSSDCLSPAGEYNIRLGVLKEIQPDLVATCRGQPAAYEGHPFIVEAAVAVGGKQASEGVTVYRFANRIPLLFEGGNDVATYVAMQRIKWSTYKMDQRRDKIGVFVSIVSTKIPFKGTGKEYIGADIEELRKAVRSAIMGCCSQLRGKLARRINARERADRQKSLVQYIPTVASAVVGVLERAVHSGRSKHRAGAAAAPGAAAGGHGEREEEAEEALAALSSQASGAAIEAEAGDAATRAARFAAATRQKRRRVLLAVESKLMTTQRIESKLRAAVQAAEYDNALDDAAAAASSSRGSKANAAGHGASAGGAVLLASQPLSVTDDWPVIQAGPLLLRLMPSALSPEAAKLVTVG